MQQKSSAAERCCSLFFSDDSVLLIHLLQSLSSVLSSQRSELAKVEHLDCCLDLSSSESGLLVVVEQLAGLLHEFLKETDHHVVEDTDRLLGDAHLWLQFFHHSEDVGSKSVVVSQTSSSSKLLLLGSFCNLASTL